MQRRPAVLILAPTLALTAFAPAQAAWTQLTPAAMPSPRAGTQGVTDGSSLLIFGGKPGPGVELDDLWSFDGTNWSNITPAGAVPPARDFYGAAYDAARGAYVLFGGRSSALGVNLGDTWEFDGAGWTQLTPGVAPSARRWCAMAYHVAQNECILFGGFDGTVYNNETWGWNGATWSLKSPTASPSIRGRGRLSHDITRGETVYYGGRDAGGALGDTWIWDGTDWSQVATAVNGPGSGGVAGLFAYGMTYDLLRDRHVIFGGTRNGPTLANTWEFDGNDWTQRAVVGPSSRTGCALAFVIGQGKSFLFGGFGGPQFDDTWEYQTSPLASADAFGSGCTGSGGLLGLAGDNAPWVGDTFTATISNLAAGSLVFNVVGLSNTAWVGGSLPAALGLIHPAGGAGCDLLVSNDAVSLIVATGSTAQTSLVLPNDPGLAGVVLYQQALEIELDASLNITSINSTNGLTITVGVR